MESKYMVGLNYFRTFAAAEVYAQTNDFWFIHDTVENKLYDVRDAKWLTYEDMVGILLEMND